MRSTMKHMAAMTTLFAASMMTNNNNGMFGGLGRKGDNPYRGNRTAELPDTPLPKGTRWYKLDPSGEETPYQDCTEFECVAINLKSAQKKFKKYQDGKNAASLRDKG